MDADPGTMPPGAGRKGGAMSRSYFATLDGENITYIRD